MLDYPGWRALLVEERLPALIVDLDAVDRNLALLAAPIEGRPLTLRIASKSIRHPWLLRHLLERGGERIRGLMTYSPFETAFLAERGFDDLLLAYPLADRAGAAAMAGLAARGVRAIAMVDDAANLKPLSDAARRLGVEIPVCLDIDASLRLAGQHLGVRRSPLRGAAEARALAERIQGTAGVRLAGIMAYEAQVAGVRDRDPRRPWMAPAIRWLKGRSIPAASARRAAVVAAISEVIGGPPELVNGGGTGSVRSTSEDPSVTEITAGSGFLGPHLFDGYRGLPLEPAAFFALRVTRRSDPGFVTCAGGGYVASGESGPDRAPIVHAPPGLTPIGVEGWGEVQTPFALGPAAPDLCVGDPVIARHAKAGELMERFNEALFIRGGAVVAREPTYRGLGACFL